MRNTPMDDLNNSFCGFHIPGCSKLVKLESLGLDNGTMKYANGRPSMDLSKPWMYYESYPTVDGYYEIQRKKWFSSIFKVENFIRTRLIMHCFVFLFTMTQP